MSINIVRLVAKVGAGDEAAVKTFRGRMAWALAELVAAGADGLTTLQKPAPRWSDYVMKLRRDGVGIATEHVAHQGAYPGHHGRYRLTVPVDVIEVERDGVSP
jgi:hypothetical protein